MPTQALVGLVVRQVFEPPANLPPAILGYRQTRYVHTDGYPQSLGLVLASLLHREGNVTVMAETLLISDWIAIRPDVTANDNRRLTWAITPDWGYRYGYQIAPPREGGLVDPTDHTRLSGPVDYPWMYLLDPTFNQILLFQGQPDGYILAGLIDYDLAALPAAQIWSYLTAVEELGAPNG